MTRVLVVDDEAVVRSGLRMILEAHDGIEVVGEAADGREALDLISAVEADVALVDIRMPVLDGIETTRRIVARGPSPRVIVLTTFGLDENVYAAFKVGAAGFFVKTDSPDELVQAVRAVDKAESLVGRETTRRLVEHFLSGPSPNPPMPAELSDLTDRELEVLRLLAGGLSNAELAEKLYVSEGTVKTHVARILSKLGLRDRVQAVVFAYERGVVRPHTSSSNEDSAERERAHRRR